MPTLAAWLHTIDPYLVVLPGGFPIRWYGLSYLAAFALGYLLIRRVAQVGRSDLAVDRVGDLIMTLAFGTVIGGRLGYCLFYKPALLTQFEDSFPFWGVLDMMGGGMASHGGIGGVIAASIWFAHRQKLPWLHVLDLAAFAAPLGLFCGRMANFINGELYGRRCDPGFRWATQFPQEVRDDPALRQAMTDAFGRELPRNWLELLQSGNEPLQQAAAAVLPARHPSPLYAGTLEGLVVFAVLAVVWWKPRRAGTVAGAFALSYAVARLVNEQFREPDAYLGLQALGLSRGQWLSVPVFAAGLVVLFTAYRLKSPILGGWRRGPWTVEKSAAAHEPSRAVKER